MANNEADFEKRALGICCCSIANAAVVSFSKRIVRASRTNDREEEEKLLREADGSLKLLLSRGKSIPFQNYVDLLQWDKEDLSCPRFLHKAWRSLYSAKEFSEDLSQYSGAYLSVAAQLLQVFAKAKKYNIPEEIQYVRNQFVSLQNSNWQNFLGITKSIKEIIYCDQESWKYWFSVRQSLGDNIISDVVGYFDFANEPRGPQEKEIKLKACIYTILIWIRLAQRYMKLVEDSNDDDEIKKQLPQIQRAIEIEVQDTFESVRKLYTLAKQDSPIGSSFVSIQDKFPAVSKDLQEFLNSDGTYIDKLFLDEM